VFLIVALSIPQFVNRLPSEEDGPNGWKHRYEELAESLHRVSPYPLHSVLPLRADQSNFYQSVKKLFAPERIGESIKDITVIGLRQVTELVLILFIILFLLLESELLAGKVRAIFGTGRDTQHRVSQTLAAIAEGIRTYLYWRTIVNFGLAIVLGLFYKYVCNLEQYVLWAVVTFVFTYVPYIGTLAAGVLPMMEALIQGQPVIALVIMFVYIAVVTFEGYVIVPWVMGRSMDLNATTVMIACLYWHLVWGLAGLFLAMPLMAIMKAVLFHVDGWKPYGDLLSSEEVKESTGNAPDVISPDAKTEADLSLPHNTEAADEQAAMPDPTTNSSKPTPKGAN
jgi:AI-2 transport protein TqsA